MTSSSLTFPRAARLLTRIHRAERSAFHRASRAVSDADYARQSSRGERYMSLRGRLLSMATEAGIIPAEGVR